jgi:hypothetical protein
MTGEQTSYEWHRHPDAAARLGGLVGEFIAAMPEVASLEQRLLRQASVQLYDFVDQLSVAAGGRLAGELAELGFTADPESSGAGGAVLRHPGADFPRIRLVTDAPADPDTPVALGIQVEDLPRFLMTWGAASPIAGSRYSAYRHAVVHEAQGRRFIAGERRRLGPLDPQEAPGDHDARVLDAFETWGTRKRSFADLEEGLAQTEKLAAGLVERLGVDQAAWTAFAAERAYWEQRNTVGRVQRRRQDAFGLGWANHDHHTFRCSRRAFQGVIRILETFGFHCRERFYAGAEAGWGAQVLEQRACGLAVFADVDLGPGEVDEDIAHRPLPERDELGTVGLWCALHGESMLEAGFHHVAGRFDFSAFDRDIAAEGFGMMKPFSEFPYLRQAFSQGERWAVPAERLARLEAAGVIDAQQRERFAEKGVIGSHIENIQRAEGFRGFNQQNVSDIIRRTDPRSGGPA